MFFTYYLIILKQNGISNFKKITIISLKAIYRLVSIVVTECFLWLRRLGVGFTPRVPWIQPGLVLEGFMMVKTALWQACSSASAFPYKCHSTNAPTSF